MFDTSGALADMASQIRACRGDDGLTLQQLATRSGVAASTIHKVEARQMVPTVSVLLKIAKGLGRRPEELIRDRVEEETAEINPESTLSGSILDSANSSASSEANLERASNGLASSSPCARPNVGVWHIDVSQEKALPTLDLDPLQRAIVLVERGEVALRAGEQRVQMDTGDCIEVEGGRIQSGSTQAESASLMLIVSPPGDLNLRLGQPSPSTPTFS